MEISKEAIISKTHYGLNIYAHVLQYYYPGQTVLSLSGRDCPLAKNPFNNNKTTLKIAIRNNCAQHQDVEDSANNGDAFSFAALHYRLEGQELYSKLNDEMNLKLADQRVCQKPQASKQPAIIDIPFFSYFKNPVTNIFPARQTSLAEVYLLIKSDSFLKTTETLREITDPKKAKEFKAAQFDYVTFSGTFSKRSDKALLKHSGLLTIDFDHLKDPPLLKAQLLEDEYFDTELIFISPSGDGLKWVISIDVVKATHLDYFKSISNYIMHHYRHKIDPSGKDISRACFLPHDAGVYINPKLIQ